MYKYFELDWRYGFGGYPTNYRVLNWCDGPTEWLVDVGSSIYVKMFWSMHGGLHESVYDGLHPFIVESNVYWGWYDDIAPTWADNINRLKKYSLERTCLVHYNLDGTHPEAVRTSELLSKYLDFERKHGLMFP